MTAAASREGPLARASTGPSRDLREGGRWTAAQAVKNALVYAAVSGALRALAPWPEAWLRRFGRAVGRLAHALGPATRSVATANLARAMPALSAEARTALARTSYEELGAHLAELLLPLSGRSLSPLPLEDAARSHFTAALREGRGVVFLSAHLGPWERVAASLVAAGLPLTALARESYDPRFTKLFDKLRAALGVPVLYRGATGAPARIVRTLKAGRILGIPMDLRSRVPSVTVPFLGHPAETAVGPARIALRTGAAVLVGTAARADPGAGLQITATPIAVSDLEAGRDGERELTTRINEELSRRILAMPEAWLWMHPRFGVASSARAPQVAS